MPEYLTPEAMQKMLLVPMAKKGKSHPIRSAIEAMKPGTILHIKREEFTWKGRTPKLFCNAISKTGKRKFTVYKQQDAKGWIIKCEK